MNRKSFQEPLLFSCFCIRFHLFLFSLVNFILLVCHFSDSLFWDKAASLDFFAVSKRRLVWADWDGVGFFLSFDELKVLSLSFDQLLMCSFFDDVSFVYDDYLVCILNCGQSMGDDDRCDLIVSFSYDLVDCFLDFSLVSSIESWSGFVKD